MLEHIYSSKSDLPSLDSGFPFFSADPPPTWRSEVEALAEMREVPCPRVKEEETAYHTSASQDREDEERAGLSYILLTSSSKLLTHPPPLLQKNTLEER